MKIWEDEKQVYIRASMERNAPEQNAALKERLEQIDWSILEHIQRKETVNERGVFAPLEAVEVPEIEARRDEFKAAGLDAIRAGKVGAVLLAGGQGTRLGLDRPKGTLNIGVNRELYLFEQLFRNLMDVTDEAGADGEVVISIPDDPRYEIKLVLQYGSKTNNWLLKQYNNNKQTPGSGLFNMQIKDLGSNPDFTASKAWVSKPAPCAYGKTGQSQEWTLRAVGKMEPKN